MNRVHKTNLRFRVYLALMGGMAIVLLFFALKDSFGIGSHSAIDLSGSRSAQAEPVSEPMNAATAQNLLPFLWARTVGAGERVSADMFVLKDLSATDGSTAVPELELNEQVLLISGRYLKEGQLAGRQIDRNLLSDEIPLKANKGKQAIWIKMSEKQSNVFSNYVSGHFVAAFVSNALDAGTSIPAALEQLRILALDRAENALCLELSAAEHMQILNLTERAGLIFVPTTAGSRIDMPTTGSLLEETPPPVLITELTYSAETTASPTETEASTVVTNLTTSPVAEESSSTENPAESEAASP